MFLGLLSLMNQTHGTLLGYHIRQVFMILGLSAVEISWSHPLFRYVIVLKVTLFVEKEYSITNLILMNEQNICCRFAVEGNKVYGNFTLLISDGERNSYENLPSYHDYDYQTTNAEFLSKKYSSSNFESTAESHPRPDIKVQLEDVLTDGSVRVLFSNLMPFKQVFMFLGIIYCRISYPVT